MVSSLDGKATAVGEAGPIGSPIGSKTDRALMSHLRARADAVMIGAGTLRAEKLTLAVPENLARDREAHGLKPQPLAVLATASGDLPLGTNLLGSSPENLVVLAPPNTPPREHLSAHAAVEEIPPAKKTDESRRLLDLKRALETLKNRYAVSTLLVEGGPALNHSLISEGLADELFLTLAPKVLGGERPGTFTILEGPTTPRGTAQLLSIHLSAADELFLRYAL